jgi:transposase
MAALFWLSDEAWRRSSRTFPGTSPARGGWTTGGRSRASSTCPRAAAGGATVRPIMVRRPRSTTVSTGGRRAASGSSCFNRKRAVRYDRERYKGRHLVENAFCRLEDFRRIATRYDKLAANFLSGVALATALAFWL